MYDFSKIGSTAQEQLKNGGAFAVEQEANHKPPRSKTSTPMSLVKGAPTNLYTFTMPDGTTLSSKSLSEFEKKIANAKRGVGSSEGEKSVKRKRSEVQHQREGF